jgi:hypothetical protein
MIEPRSEKDELRSEGCEDKATGLAVWTNSWDFADTGEEETKKEDPFIIEPRSKNDDPRSEATVLDVSERVEGSEGADATAIAEVVFKRGCCSRNPDPFMMKPRLEPTGLGSST